MTKPNAPEVHLFIVHEGGKHELVGAFPNRNAANEKIVELGPNVARLRAFEGVELRLGLVGVGELAATDIKLSAPAAPARGPSKEAPYGYKLDGTPRRKPGRRR